MRLIATEQGLLIPKEMLGKTKSLKSFKNRKNYYYEYQKESSIWDLGSNPVECDLKDGAVNHDHYLYIP